MAEITSDWYRLFPNFPTVLVTVKADGVQNIITLSMVHVFSFSPPLVGIGVAPRRYSYNLLKKAKEFVINIPTEELFEATLLCGTKSGRDTDKFAAAHLTPQQAEKVSAPLIKECKLKLECKVVKEIETGDHTWFVGRIEALHVEKDYDRTSAITYWGREFRVAGRLIGTR